MNTCAIYYWHRKGAISGTYSIMGGAPCQQTSSTPLYHIYLHMHSYIHLISVAAATSPPIIYV